VSLAASVDGTTQPAQVAGMAQGLANAPSLGASEPLPAVSLELRTGSALPTVHDLHDVSFLIGTVPGCDLRLPGANLPSVVCLLSRHAGGVTLRKLAPVHTITINGKAATVAPLADGDSIRIGSIELRIRVTMKNPVGWVESSRPTDIASPTQEQGSESVGFENSTHPTPAVLESRQKQLDEQMRSLEADRAEWDHRCHAEREQESARQAALQARVNELEAERRALADCLQVRDSDLAAKTADTEQRERKLIEERVALEKAQAQHRDDLVRLDRLQGSLEQRDKELRIRGEELDRGFAQLRQNVAELEEQARQLDEWHTKLIADAEALSKKKEEHATAVAQLNQRAAALEGQQAMLATLRTRLERMREDVRREEKQLAEQRVAHAAAEAETQLRLKEAEDLRAELDNEKQLRESESAQYHERQALMESAVARLREAQEATGQQEELLRQREAEVTTKTNALDERAAVVEARAEQLVALQQRMTADRETLNQREAALTQAEQTLAALQEQLRRRSEELAARQKAQGEQTRQYEETLAALDARRGEIEREGQQAEERVAQRRLELDARATELERRGGEVENSRLELARREETLVQSIERLKAAGRAVGQGRKELADERARSEADKQRIFATLSQAHRDFEAARDEVIDLQRQLPELELQARESAERLVQAREQLRGHMAEVHAYSRQSREDLEMLREQVRAEAERVRQQETTLHRDRDEHRLAVADFRQQLIDWQGQVEDLKRALARGETRLERRRAEVDKQVRAVDETSQRLARQAEELQQQEKAVAERRGEVERHLEDMRLWYRRKLRELAGIPAKVEETHLPPAMVQTETKHGEREGEDRGILSLTGDVDPADRQLGDLLQSLGLVDADTLTALLVEARRQRRSLRQLLLAGNYLTLYQMALIEAGDLDALILGPVRVIDRLRATPTETIYRVFDPRCNHEALLRHLGEGEMQDAVRPDEYRQRFTAAAAVRHPHIAATLEVLDIAGRPAALQESLKGLPSTDWPPLAGTPGVWFRLANQAFLGLQAAHHAGLVHGHLSATSIILTPEGVLKLVGFGEPSWLADSASTDTPQSDVAMLGRLVAAWTETPSGRKPRTKPLPAGLQEMLNRLTATDPSPQFAGPADVLEALDRVSAEVPANAAAWERFVRQASEQATDAAVRLSA
jgi:hypothetical protein